MSSGDTIRNFCWKFRTGSSGDRAPGTRYVTQRGNRRQRTFFCGEDYRSYLELMGQWWGVHQVAVWAYCSLLACTIAIESGCGPRSLARAGDAERAKHPIRAPGVRMRSIPERALLDFANCPPKIA